MIRFFNPGHETAVLNASKYYQPPVSVAKMQRELALLPAWYADCGDFILVDENNIFQLNDGKNFEIRKVKIEDMANQEVDLWGISPQSIHFFNKISGKYCLNLKVPTWKEEFRFLGSRMASQKVVSLLADSIPEIDSLLTPKFFSSIEEIEDEAKLFSACDMLVKAPFSSSGRGLVRLKQGKIARSERQIISGFLKKQAQVSLEKFLNKKLDFSMHFEVLSPQNAVFVGYSVFYTNEKGVWQKTLLANQQTVRKLITSLINEDLLDKIKQKLTQLINEMYLPYYQGNIGVDMLVYEENDSLRLHPCVEINMRKSMGYLALKLFEKRINPQSRGFFQLDFYKDSGHLNENHRLRQAGNPLVSSNGLIDCGYLNLCPVAENTNYNAFIDIKI